MFFLHSHLDHSTVYFQHDGCDSFIPALFEMAYSCICHACAYMPHTLEAVTLLLTPTTMYVLMYLLSNPFHANEPLHSRARVALHALVTAGACVRMITAKHF